MRRILPIAASLLPIALGPSSLLAQERYDDATMKELQRFNIDIGYFFIYDVNSTFRLDSKAVPIGTVVDAEDTLKVDSSADSVRIDGFYRFNRKHRLDWTYYRSERSGIATIQDDITIGDPDNPEEECTIGTGATVASDWEFDLFKVGYSWSFLNTRRYELFLGGGLNIRDLTLTLDADGNITGCGISSGDSTTIDAEGTVPLPSFNFGGRWNFTPKWQARWQLQVFALQVGDYKGSTRDTQLMFEHRTFKNVGFGLGLNSFDLTLEAEDDDLRGEITSDYIGTMLYVKAYF